MIVEIEGCDAVGKATQAQVLAERLHGTCITAPDYATETGKAILGNLKRDWCVSAAGSDRERTAAEANRLNAHVFQSLMILNRYEMLPRIALMLAKGPVVFDRWTSSSTVYGACAGLDSAWCDRVQLALPQADVHILIDISIEESFKRRPERRDRHEADRPFLERVRMEYLRRWGVPDVSPLFRENEVGGWWGSSSKNTKPGKWYTVNGLNSIEQVHKSICHILNGIYGDDVVNHLKPWAPAAGWGDK